MNTESWVEEVKPRSTPVGRTMEKEKDCQSRECAHEQAPGGPDGGALLPHRTGRGRLSRACVSRSPTLRRVQVVTSEVWVRFRMASKGDERSREVQYWIVRCNTDSVADHPPGYGFLEGAGAVAPVLQVTNPTTSRSPARWGERSRVTRSHGQYSTQLRPLSHLRFYHSRSARLAPR